MTKSVLFFVHGIGRHGKGWIDEPGGPVETLDAAMKLYPACFPAGKKLRDYFDVIEVRYDDIFDHVLKTWSELANSLPTNTGLSWVSEVQQLLTKAGDDSNTFARFGGDVLLYCGFALVARAARLRVNSVVASTIFATTVKANAANQDPPKFAVIAHSMGTTVAQDALSQLATGNWVADRSELERTLASHPTLFNNPDLDDAQKKAFDSVLEGLAANPDRSIPVGLTGLFLVSNTAPLLRQSPKFYSDLPTGSGALDCKELYVITHEFDPVSRVGRTSTGAPPSRQPIDVEVRHFHDKNIHGFGHYLSHPAVHSELFGLLVSDFSQACYDNAQSLAKTPLWQGLGGKLKDLADDKRAELEGKLREAVSNDKSIVGLRETIEKYFKKLGEL